MPMQYTRVARLKSAELFRRHIEQLGIHLPFDEQLIGGDASPLAQPYTLRSGRVIGNRFCTSPMEGWDGTQDGKPTEYTTRRWQNFGRSGAKLIWGGEAVAVRHDGRANPNQLVIKESNLDSLADLRAALVREHRSHFGSSEDLFVGLQLTHSGRFSRPNEKTRLEPVIAYHHPLVDGLFGIPADLPVITDAEIEALIEDFIRAAGRAQQIGFDFVDIKHCHGYFGHELLSAHTRPGSYGGSLENRTRFLREIVTGIRREFPELNIGVRLSAFDFPPFSDQGAEQAAPLWWRDEAGQYPFAFGADPQDPLSIHYDEILAFLEVVRGLDLELVNISAGSPYYNPHITRPAYFPPSDGYQPPEDPLVGVARQINAVAQLKERSPGLAFVGSAYSYLQEWIPNVAQAVVRTGKADFVGLGRMVLSYPELPADVLQGRPLNRKLLCRSFSDCTTAPRKGLISGCYPLDEYYKQLPEAQQLKQIKAGLRARTDSAG
jgi:2,4-dienoyl-CoA reductase-like NADH-dependent reductase (Old Yellow Enzyme family)